MNDEPKKATPEQVQEHQRALRAIQGGMQYLVDEAVIGPMKHADGISDLKWLLRKLMVGEWGLNMDPQNPAGRLPTDRAEGPPKVQPTGRVAAKTGGRVIEESHEGSGGNGK